MSYGTQTSTVYGHQAPLYVSSQRPVQTSADAYQTPKNTYNPGLKPTHARAQLDARNAAVLDVLARIRREQEHSWRRAA